VILPDDVTLDVAYAAKIQAYLDGGGKLLLSGASGLNAGRNVFALDFGLTLEGRSEFDPDYLVATELSPTPRVRGPFVAHGGAWNVTATGWPVLARRRDPYFNRTWEHFCSHQHTPDAEDSPYPGVVCNGRIAYFAHPIFTWYRKLGQPLYRDLVADALQVLLPEPSVETNLPTAGRVTLTHQPNFNRYVLHLLFAVPQKRGAEVSRFASPDTMVEVIEDLYPLHRVKCRVRVPHPITSLRLVPDGREIPLECTGGTVEFTLPELLCHQMVEVGY
jgi:hypothetical protein